MSMLKTDFVRLLAITETLKERVAELVAENTRLRAKLAEWASECSGCDGTGLQTVPDAMQPAFGRTIACADCEDIREALA